MKLNDVGALWCCGGASHGKFYGVYCHHVRANRIPFIAPPVVAASPLKIQLQSSKDFDVADRFFQEYSIDKEMQTTEKLSIQRIVLFSG